MEYNELRILQRLPLEIKVMKSLARVEEWYRYFGGKVYVSFSGGKDSTVLLHLVRSLYPDVEAVFVNTGLEYPEIVEFVNTTENVRPLRPKTPFNQVIRKYGYPLISKEQSQFIHQYTTAKSEKTKETRLNGNKYGRGKISEKWKYLLKAPFKISDQCCDIMKKKPAKAYEKETGNYAFIGKIAEESSKRIQDYLKTGCNAFDNKRPVSNPLGFWTEKDIWDYLKIYNVPYSKIYDMGYDRTGCMFCMYGVHLEKGENRFQRMQRTHPKQHEYCMKESTKGGLGLAKVLDYINVPYEDNIANMKTSEGINYEQYKMNLGDETK